MELSAAGTQAPAASAANLNSLAASLGHIAGLFSAGLLTESEFSAAKSTVLGLASPQQPVAVPAAAAEAPAVLLAAVMAEQVDEPVMAAAVPVEEHTRIHTAVAEHRVVARGKEKKKRKRAERASSDSDDTDSDGTNCQRNGAARTPAHQSAQQDQFPPGLVFNKAWDLEGLTWYSGVVQGPHRGDDSECTKFPAWRLCRFSDGVLMDVHMTDSSVAIVHGASTKPTVGTASSQRIGAAHAARSGGTASKSMVSRFHGVSWHKSSRRWQAQLGHDGQRHFLGFFAEDKEEDAARAFDTAARNLRGARAHGGRNGTTWCYLNFPTEAEVAGATEAAAAASRPNGHSSRFHGVYWHKARSKWQAELQHDGKKHHLGSFAEDKEEDAAHAYDTAARKLRGANAGLAWQLNYPTPVEAASAAGTAATMQ